MTWQFGHVATFCRAAHPAARRLWDVVILDLHGDGRADAREGVAHQCDQSPVAQTEQHIRLNRIEHLAHFLGREHGGLSLFDIVLGAARGTSRVERDDLTDDSQSKSMRMAARYFTAGLEWVRPSSST
jgi:hypothetical protein